MGGCSFVLARCKQTESIQVSEVRGGDDANYFFIDVFIFVFRLQNSEGREVEGFGKCSKLRFQ